MNVQFIFSSKVSAVAQQVLWNCLIEDPSTVLRHFLEKLTISNRQVKSYVFIVALCVNMFKQQSVDFIVIFMQHWLTHNQEVLWIMIIMNKLNFAVFIEFPH